MKIKKPTSTGQRFVIKNDFKEITEKKNNPVKSLIIAKKQKAGRDNKGQISMRRRGGGSKKHYRLVDFSQTTKSGEVKVERIEYDPNRSANIALLIGKDQKKCYVLAVEGLKKGQIVKTGDKVPLKIGNRTFLKNIPIGTYVNNVELNPGQGGCVARAAGTSAQLTALDNGMAQLLLSSGELRLVKDTCMATIGIIGNKDHHNVRLGKAGVKRHLGRRPKVRGAAMNPNDHPHGGGEGKAPVGNRRGPRTKWGKKAYGVKTRKGKKYSDKLILKRRKKIKKR